MNFRKIIFALILLLLSACGVKSPPIVPPESRIPSYIEKFVPKIEPPESSDNSLKEKKSSKTKKTE